MSWSLQLRRGDLTLGGSSYGTVTGADKLVQDLRCALLEPFGYDEMHRDFGSVLDGGVMDGVEYKGPIGRTDFESVRNEIEIEIRRVAREHQRSQINRSNRDINKYGNSTLTNRELLRSISSIDTVQINDIVFVRVSLSLGDTDRTIDIPLSTT